MKAWSPPGRFRAPCGPQAAARKAPNGSWGRPGEPKQIIGWTPGPPRGAKLIDFRLPGGSPEGSGEALGWHFWSFFGHAARGTEKQGKISKNKVFLLVECLLFIYFLVLFGFLVAAPAGEWTLKNH